MLMIVLHQTLAITLISPGGLPKPQASQNELTTILNVVFAIAGALALLMIVISGLKYITAAGEPKDMSEARKGIIYALVGLVLVIVAQAAVAFVIQNICGPNSFCGK